MVATVRPLSPASRLLWILLVSASSCSLVHPSPSMKLTKLYSDDAREFNDSGMIACHRCATQQERPADYRQGICIYAKQLGKKKVTGKTLKESVAGLIKNKCGKCGSIAVDPATGIPDGQIKVNFMRDSCETGVCPQRSPGDAFNAPRSVDAPQKKSLDHVPYFSPRQDDSNSRVN